jgi:cytidylate kinase
MALPLTIAIDGFSSCGKSTLARDLANELGYTYIDSGAMYRAVTLYFLRTNIDINDLTQIQEALSQISIDFTQKNVILLNGEDVTLQIRHQDVSDFVSEVAAISIVRKKLVELQQDYGKNGGIVMDGRDIATVVFPSADLKIFLTADPMIRAQRRFMELEHKGMSLSMDEVIHNLQHRDRIDSTRADSPLIQDKNAILLDNSHLDRQAQLQFVLNLVKPLL